LPEQPEESKTFFESITLYNEIGGRKERDIQNWNNSEIRFQGNRKRVRCE